MGLCISLLGGKPVPLHRLGIILRHALAIAVVHDPEVAFWTLHGPDRRPAGTTSPPRHNPAARLAFGVHELQDGIAQRAVAITANGRKRFKAAAKSPRS